MPQHFLGLQGMPRRVPDYPDAFTGWNTVSSVGSVVSVIATGVFLYVIYNALVSQPRAQDNAWGQPGYFLDSPTYETMPVHSNSLEWCLPAPTPYHAYQMVPVQS